MNNSLPRLIDGMVATLRKEVIPHIEGDFARGQAFGVIYMLNSLKLRASWSNEFLIEQLRALEDAARELDGLGAGIPAALVPGKCAPREAPAAAELEAMRDQGDERISALIEWLASNRESVSTVAAAHIEAAIDRYLHRQLKWELSTSAKPMFVEISGGVERSA
jgi:hypothetical protein